jgi:hypothetical protein
MSDLYPNLNAGDMTALCLDPTEWFAASEARGEDLRARIRAAGSEPRHLIEEESRLFAAWCDAKRFTERANPPREADDGS